ncbi:MAG: transcriptional repressor NrdR [Coriobacteriales bacterium]|nr:transcriptional repressor NrdR [Coriobacteriales bacterium]MBQ6586752.1 transcriptional repressor NrdR [Coriobacteriales bacterium]
MRCPVCGNPDTKVIDSRVSVDGSSIRRRRECLECAARFTTYERVELTPLLISKKDGSIEPFNREKLMHGVFAACVKRNIPVETIEALIDDVESEARAAHRSTISSQQLGDMVLRRLRELDGVAYIRFASVYKDFKNLDEFTKELENLN